MVNKTSANPGRGCVVKINDSVYCSKVQQIVIAMVGDIEKGRLKKEQKLPSINQFSEEHGVARDTVEKAYKQLRRDGYIVSIPGRGYFVDEKNKFNKRVLLVFDQFSSSQKTIYENLMEAVGQTVKVSLQIHLGDPVLLKGILEDSIGKYDYYVIMPFFVAGADEKEYFDVLRRVPPHQLILLDKGLSHFAHSCRAVYQHFRNDIYEALCSSETCLHKYKDIMLVVRGEASYLNEITRGVQRFCREQRLRCHLIYPEANVTLRKNAAYIFTDDESLVETLKQIRNRRWSPGKDLGILSFNETAFKELLDITVVITDFKAIGKTVASLILGQDCKQHINPFRIIRRGSL